MTTNTMKNPEYEQYTLRVVYWPILTLLMRHEFYTNIQLVRGGFWEVFTQLLDSKLNNSKIAYPIDLKFSGKMHLH